MSEEPLLHSQAQITKLTVGDLLERLGDRTDAIAVAKRKSVAGFPSHMSIGVLSSDLAMPQATRNSIDDRSDEPPY